MADLFDTTIDWLLAQALSDDPLSVTVQGLATRLLDGGVPLARLSLGRALLHPVIGLLNIQWDRDSGDIKSEAVPRASVLAELEVKNPFTDLGEDGVTSIIANLKDPADVARYAIFGKLAAQGITGYAAFGLIYGRKQKLFFEMPQHQRGRSENFRGASLSFATKRFSGFSQSDLEGLERLVPAICVCARVDTDRFMVNDVLETYLGRVSGNRVLTGQIDRNDLQQIECALFYSDMHASLALSQQLDAQTYLDTVNAYFDCTANAVLDHGGEVLKFIGDGILAIFPIEPGTRPRDNMCTAALAAAREAFARADHANTLRGDQKLPPVNFGVALHVGEVIYGNVGIEKRLDFTATGPQVGLAARIEGLTRTLNAPILASEAFAAHVSETGTIHPAQQVRSFDQPITVVGYPLNPS
ncbi:adenylate/guanylate cyclase domain-containing protein [Tateyamaria pelophila]|uniref:adenylate/guanylate cyclase domain-containing protein n=1 Tax=Tateyamaria pelophila TaxID=328415 RepID=UPI001CBCFDCF|nr:adenylate/guanylate cyclase domain-containing protein [Tateyamaria pelophila]